MTDRDMADATMDAPSSEDHVSHGSTPAPREGETVTRIKGDRFNLKLSRRTLMGMLLRCRDWYGGKRVCLIDADDRKLTYNDLIRASFALGHALKAGTRKGEAIGVLLPTSAGAAVAFFGVSAHGRVPAMLNFTSGASALKAACAAAEARKIVTARKFIELGNLQHLVAALEADHEIVYLEDVRDSLTRRDKASAVLGTIAPWAARAHADPDSPGVILFTSGTEGDPKGVVLSHANLVANGEQCKQHIPELYPSDIAISPLPTFHCFGLTGGLILPLLAGFPSVLHPTPLQAKTIVERVRSKRATILFATDTFLNQYARVASDDDLSSLRFAVCGAERVKDTTRASMRQRFGLEVLEGYGATEAAPVIAVNQVNFNKPGTVGRLLPGMEARLDAVAGITDGGRFLVRGPNVMKGYLHPNAPGVIDALDDGWHDTGDIVSIDDDGCITIRGRVKRFAKVGGEMVSLAVVENCATSLWPDNSHAAIAVPDPRKGEQILLITDYARASRADFVAFARNLGVAELAVPRHIIHVDAVPLLGSGKVDYGAVERLAQEQPLAEA